MSGKDFLLDTNIVLYLLSGDQTLANTLEGKNIFISFITELELYGFSKLTKDEENAISIFLSDCTITNINGQIKKRTIALRKNHPIKLPDAIIAATSQFLAMPLITADKGFDKIEEVVSLIYKAN